LAGNARAKGDKDGATAFEIRRKDIKETLRIQGSGKALFPDTEPAAKISVLAKGESGFA